ncbi:MULTISPECIES: SMI1/KNR4 family protein [Winogradskyella]|uniref:SMI1/KNR4 family protein n=1 Tax=Winogradskyella TaxID=286104 RepID=UPI0015CBF917|nr:MULTISPECIES: SMI1/KNR4 family protein [Winogradskyella]QXP78492.1 SMI1/KNR4 family protein [Winogradskyella sp. HaHa_3_26]
MDTIANKYIATLKCAYYNAKGKDIWDHFESIKHGAASEHLDQVKLIFPEVPEALLHLLTFVDGTYWRTYGDDDIILFFLGSDMAEYPYYLLSSEQIIENENVAASYYSDYIERAYEGVDIDEKITNKSENLKWLHFSDCMNNGGTSQLFIDFSPSEKGTKGQVVRFLHDPDEFKVIADSFEDYLQMMMDNEIGFINEDNLE